MVVVEAPRPQTQVTIQEFPLQGRRILVTGGSSGTGLATAIDVYKLGAEVLIGTRSQERYAANVIPAFQREVPGFDGERIRPFVGDIAKPEETIEAFERLRARGLTPTDVVHSAAGGMESFLPKLGLGLARLRRVQQKTPDEFEERKGELQREVQAHVQESIPYANAVNFGGPKKLFEHMVGKLSDGAMLIDYSSLWSTFLKNVPGFYEGIAQTKHAFEGWLEEAGWGLTRSGIGTAIIGGDVIRDTGVGEAIERFIAPLLSDAERTILTGRYITRADMVAATRSILLSEPQDWTNYPRRLYVYGDNGVVQTTNNLTAEHPMFDVALPI